MTTLAIDRRAERVTTSVSLVAGPLVMSIGDLLHPEERMLPVEQIAIVVDHASRWYTAHLLLFVGMGPLSKMTSSFGRMHLSSAPSAAPHGATTKPAAVSVAQ